MLKISKDGEVFINGQTINEFVNSNSTSVKRTVIINNGKVVKDDFQNIEGFENFQNNFADQMDTAFKFINKTTKTKCSYCGSQYPIHLTKCPNCGASDNESNI